MLVKARKPSESEFKDLLQAGGLGLLKSLEKYDANKKQEDGKSYAFLSYAGWWIKQYIHRELQVLRQTVKIPEPRTQRINLLKRITLEREQSLGRRLSFGEVKEIELGLKLVELEKAGGRLSEKDKQELRNKVFALPTEYFVNSLNLPIGGEEDAQTGISLLENESTFSDPLALLTQQNLLKRIKEVLDLFPDNKYSKQKLAFKLKYLSDFLDDNNEIILGYFDSQLWLNSNSAKYLEIFMLPSSGEYNSEENKSEEDGVEYTNVRISKILGVSPERVRQILVAFVVKVERALRDPRYLKELKESAAATIN